MVNFRNARYLEVADRIGVSLCRDAMWDQDRCNWLGWAMEDSYGKLVPVYRSCASELYGGTSGIALFLAELYSITKDKQQLRVLEGAVNQALSIAGRIEPRMQHGFYSGLCGVAYALIRIGTLLQREKLTQRGLTMMSRLHEVAIDTQFIDVIIGSAGAIPALLAVARRYQHADFLALAVRHGENLLELAQPDEHGYSWQTIGDKHKGNLSGHSHGVAGIVTAMLELHHVTNDARFLHAALEGLRYERHLFHADQGNWLDLRDMQNFNGHAQKKDEACSMAWCHGAPGIGMSRLRNSVLLPDHEGIRADLEVALATTAASLSAPWKPGNGNYSLCHGAAGNAELMLMAGRQLGRPELVALAEKVGEEGIEFYVKQGLPWPCGNGGAGETPNLMLGTAGIGYFYLRLFDPVAVPSVLLISPE